MERAALIAADDAITPDEAPRVMNGPWGSRTAPTVSRLDEATTSAQKEAAHLQVLADSLHMSVGQLVRMGRDEARKLKRALNAA